MLCVALAVLGGRERDNCVYIDGQCRCLAGGSEAAAAGSCFVEGLLYNQSHWN